MFNRQALGLEDVELCNVFVKVTRFVRTCKFAGRLLDSILHVNLADRLSTDGELLFAVGAAVSKILNSDASECLLLVMVVA